MKRAIFILVFTSLLLCGCNPKSREPSGRALDLYDSGSEVSPDRPDLI